ncbi:MAG: glycoside hydrolase family 11 protein [Ruminococcus sp.]|nr:glycoside hydrolase family 11 protein [Ruminococcus sp.]
MNINGIKRVASGLVASFICLSSANLGITMNAHADKVLTTSPSHTQETGTYGDYHHEIWQADTPNSSTMTLYESGGGFSTTWKCGPNNSKGNFLARRGLFYGLNNSKHWQDYGGFTCDFDCDWSAGSSGNSRICIYGWTQNPLVEFYIIEDWKNWRPTSNNAKQVTIDGSVYDVFTNPMNSYTIEGNKAFTQYISVRRDTRTKGTISISEHFKAWEDLGMKMGGLYEVAFNVEGWESDGQADVKKNIITEGTPVPTQATTAEPQKADADGNFITESFEDGKGSFKGRGDATVSVDTKNYYDGSASLKVTDRGDNWHGGSISLSSSELVPGETYSISAAGLQKSGSTAELKLTLEYTKSSGDQDWMDIASADAKSGEWTDLSNTKFTVPSGASGMSIYIESPDSLTDLWIDSFKISEEGKASSVTTGKGVVDGSGTVIDDPPAPTGQMKGDFCADKVIDTFDLVAGRQALLKYMSGSTSGFSLDTADVDGDGAFAVNDLVVLSKFLLGQIKEFPKSSAASTTTTTRTQTPATTTSSSGGSSSSGGYTMASIANDMKTSAPNGFNTKRAGVDYGKVEKKTYQSIDGGGTKSINVILPAGYSTSKKYPVFYVLHGIGGNEDSMVQMGMQTMLGNLLADGLCEPMIIVSVNMPTGNSGGGMFSQEFMRDNDKIREDIKNSIMPYMEHNYSVATGRENTAISGFSLGGREALYTGITNSELYGYVGGACPAPGIFPTQDSFMVHEGSLKQESQFKPSVMPNLILISAAANDGVVGNYPESYHKALQNNNVEHLWNVIPQGDHGNATVEPHMYNFMRYLFK